MSNTEKIKEDLAKKSCYEQLKGIRLLIDNYLVLEEIENVDKSLIRMNAMIYGALTKELHTVLDACSDEEFLESLIEEIGECKELLEPIK